MKIGILGGTFNPIHAGHLILAEQVREHLGLERIVFVPASLPPHKDGADIAPGKLRFEMIKLAIKGNPDFSVSDIEIQRGSRSYTIDTIKEFRKKFPGEELYFISGSDLLKYLAEWKDISDIFALAKFVVATRPGYPLENLPKEIITIPIRALDIAGFDIRQYVREGRSIRYIVPDSVIKYINKKRLYTKG